MTSHRWVGVAWVLVMTTLVVFAVPWFLWADPSAVFGLSAPFAWRETVVAGLPVWLWWHVGWMVLAAVVFRAFAARAWGLGIEEGA